MKIGALASSLRRSLPETLKAYSQIGLQGVQIFASPEYLIYPDLRLAEIRRMCGDYGLEISAFCGDIAATHFDVEAEAPDRVELHKRITDTALKLGTNVVTTHIGVVPGDKNDPAYPVMVKSIRQAAEYSAQNNAYFAIETGPEMADVLLGFIQEVNSKGLAVNLDPANLRMVSREDPVRAVELLGKYIVHTHAKDGINTYPGSAAAAYGMRNPDGSPRKFTEKPSSFKEVPLGTGQVVWDDYLSALKKSGFDGFLTIERECGDDPAGDIKLAVDFLKSKLN